MDTGSEHPAPRIEITGDGRHFAWNDDRTSLIEKVGPIDGSRPFFVLSEDGRVTPGEWPAGWTEMGATKA